MKNITKKNTWQKSFINLTGISFIKYENNIVHELEIGLLTTLLLKIIKILLDGDLINVEKAAIVEIINSEFDSSLMNGHFISIFSILQLKIYKLLFQNINSIVNNNQQSVSAVCIRTFNIFRNTIVYLSIINVYSSDNTAGMQIADNNLAIQKMKYLLIDDVINFEVIKKKYF